MARYIIKRLLQSVVTILLVVSVVFLLLRLLPTDYFFTEEELIKLTPEQQHDKLQANGLLDHPLVQLFNFYKRLFTQGDLGTSRRLQTGKSALAISLIIGVPLGILQARFKDGHLDRIGTGFTIFVNAVPHLVSYSLIMVFGSRVLGLPAMYSTRKVVKLAILGMEMKINTSSILPVACLALGSIAYYMLWMRRYMVDELNKDYIRLAKLKGFSTTQVMYRHVMKNAFLPLAQYLPYSVLLTVGGSLLVERFFSVPGLGAFLTDAIGKYDVDLVQAIVMLYASLGILGLFLGDLLMTVLDPRIRLTGKGGAR